MDLRQLRNLMAVIEKGSLGKAAEALHISQPALTKSIHRLELRLGVPLFTRDSRGMQPTVYAEALRAHAQAVSIGVEQGLLELEALKAGSIGIVKVAAPPLITNQILNRAALFMMRERPDLQISITTEINDATEDLLSGAYDFIVALLASDSAKPGLRQRKLFDDPIALVVRPGHPLTRMTKVKLEDLEAYRWVLPLSGHFHRVRLDRLFESNGLSSPNPALECSSIGLITSVVNNSDHIGVMAQMGLQDDGVRLLNLVELPIASPFLTRSIGLVWRINHVPSKSSELFGKAIDVVCQERILKRDFMSPGEMHTFPFNTRDKQNCPGSAPVRQI